VGKRVVVVDCDLRNPRLHKFFRVPNDVGFTSVLLGDVGLTAAVRDVDALPNLKILPSGFVPPNPSELLSGRRTHEVLDLLATQADFVLIDSPPIVPYTDAAVLAPHADGILLVASAGVSTRRKLARAMEILRRIEAPLAGVVLNRSVDDDSHNYSDFAYKPFGSTAGGEDLTSNGKHQGASVAGRS
jgi:capsular exopolysaccharide synthesis family protein